MYTAILIGGPRDKEKITIPNLDNIITLHYLPCWCMCNIENTETFIDIGHIYYNLHTTHGNTAIYIFNGVKL